MNEEGILATPANVIEKITELARDSDKPQTQDFYDIPWSKHHLTPVLPPKAQPIELHSLTGLAAFIQDEHPRMDATAHAVSESQVSLFGPLEPDHRIREYFAHAKLPEDTESFPFGQYLDLERFIVYAQSRMEHTQELSSVLKLVGNIKDESVKTVADDGVSQTVTGRSGIARVEDLPVPNPVTLTPYRTFREVSQPSSKFILRMKQGTQGHLPSAALFEADGGAWKLDAMQNIAAFMSELCEGLRVIA